jgi:hypothetical protein
MIKPVPKHERPAGHKIHAELELNSVTLLYVPFGHLEGIELLIGQKFPAGHTNIELGWLRFVALGPGQ